MAKKQPKQFKFPVSQFGFVEDAGTIDAYMTVRDQMEDVVDEMPMGASTQVAIYKLEKVVTVTKKSTFTVK